MKIYRLERGWQISVPSEWQAEYDSEGGQHIFYPEDSDLTVRITQFRAEKNGVPAPAEIMEKTYTGSLPLSAVPRGVCFPAPAGCGVKMFEDSFTEDGKNVHVVYAGFFSCGELLSAGIWGTDKAEIGQALSILETVRAGA